MEHLFEKPTILTENEGNVTFPTCCNYALRPNINGCCPVHRVNPCLKRNQLFGILMASLVVIAELSGDGREGNPCGGRISISGAFRNATCGCSVVQEHKAARQSPCSLAVVSICASGERKTTVDKRTTKAFRDFESEQPKVYEEKHTQFRSSLSVWNAQRRVLVRQFERVVENGESLEELQLAIIKHEQIEPSAPRRARLLYSDITSAALMHGFHDNTRSAVLIEDEAARFINGSLAEDTSLINKAWDGSDLTVDRRKGGSFSVKAPRLSLNLMVQPSAFEKYMQKKGEEARGIGFIARWLVCSPQSTQGTRFIHKVTQQSIAQTTFNKRVLELLEQQTTSGSMEDHSGEITLTFSPDAEQEWILVANQIEEAIRPGGYFCEASDTPQKSPKTLPVFLGYFMHFLEIPERKFH